MRLLTQREKRCRLPAFLVACVAPVLLAGQAWAQASAPPERVPLWYEDTTVSGLRSPNTPAVPHIPNDLPEHILQPFYFIIPAGLSRVQAPVIGHIPGTIGYTGWWKFSALLDFSGRNHETDPYTSVGEIVASLCTIPGARQNVGACLAIGTPLIDFTGAGGGTDFVINVPIVLTPPDPVICL